MMWGENMSSIKLDVLKKFCEEKLHAAQLKIEKIEKTPNGDLSLSPLDRIEE